MKSIHDYIKQVILEGETLPSTEVAFGEGDQVKVIGDVLGHGKKGRIKMVAPSGMFSVVSFDDGTEASYHNTDIEHSLDDDAEDDEIDEDRVDTGVPDIEPGFYVIDSSDNVGAGPFQTPDEAKEYVTSPLEVVSHWNGQCWGDMCDDEEPELDHDRLKHLAGMK